MGKTFYLRNKKYNTFEKAYILGYKMSGSNKPIRCYSIFKSDSIFVWKDFDKNFSIEGHYKNKKNDILIKNKDLYDCYKNIIKNAEKYFVDYDKLIIKKNEDSSVISVLSIEHLDVLIDVVKTLDKHTAKYKLGSLTDEFLNIDIENIKKKRQNKVNEEKLKKKTKEKEEKSILNIIPKEIEFSNLTKSEILELMNIKTPIFEERKIPNKEYWVEIRLQTSTLIDFTENGDFLSTLELYSSLKNEFSNKEIVLIRNNNGNPICVYKNDRTPSNISIEMVFNEFRKILDSLETIEKLKKFAKEEAEIKNLENIVSYHNLESSSFFTEEDYKRSIIKEKCRLDDRREVKSLYAIIDKLPKEQEIEKIIEDSVIKINELLTRYYNRGEDYLKLKNVNDVFSYKDEEEFNKLYSEKKSKYRYIKKSTSTNTLCCFINV